MSKVVAQFGRPTGALGKLAGWEMALRSSNRKRNVVGVDHSEAMVEQARRRNEDAIRRGCVDLIVGSVEALPAFEEPFDKVLSVNSIMFWTEPAVRLRQLRGLLRPGGVIAVVRQPRGPGSRSASKESVAAELLQLLGEAGFVENRTEVLDLKPPVVCALGVSPRL